MVEKACITHTDNQHEFMVGGTLDFDTIGKLAEKARDFIQHTPDKITFNFSSVVQSNSAGLAFLAALLQEATALQKKIQFLHLPAKLLAAANISDLDNLLPCNL